MNEYYDFTDVEIESFIYTKDMVAHLVNYDKTVQIVGIIDNTEMKPDLMKFHLCNRSGEIIQFTVWNDDITEKIKKVIVSGNIVLIDGAFARQKHAKLSGSTGQFDMSIKSNTEIKVLKHIQAYTTLQTSTRILPTVEIENAVKVSGSLEVVGFIKNAIRVTSLPNEMKINQGCLSDCTRYKLEIRMPDLSDMSEYKVGCHVRLRGTIKYGAYPYLWVMKKEDVKKESEEARKVVEVLRGTRMPKRILPHDQDGVKKEI